MVEGGGFGAQQPQQIKGVQGRPLTVASQDLARAHTCKGRDGKQGEVNSPVGVALERGLVCLRRVVGKCAGCC